MTDEEYYEFIQPYEDAKQMLLTRLDVLNNCASHSRYLVFHLSLQLELE